MKNLEITSISKNKKELINLANFILQNHVGQGSYGKVYKTKELKSGKIYAAKVFINEINDLTDVNILTDISRELNIISKLNHPSVLKFKGFSPIDFKKRQRPVIITEYASNGTLEDLISIERNSPSRSNLTETRKLVILTYVISSLA